MDDDDGSAPEEPTGEGRSVTNALAALSVLPTVCAASVAPEWVPVCVLLGIALHRHFDRRFGGSAVGPVVVSVGLCATAWILRSDGVIDGWWWVAMAAAVVEPFSRPQPWEYGLVRNTEGSGG